MHDYDQTVEEGPLDLSEVSLSELDEIEPSALRSAMRRQLDRARSEAIAGHQSSI